MTTPTRGAPDQPSYVVITPVRNEEEYIEETIRSMLGQYLRPAVWIIVDDGSQDRTPEILETYSRQVPWLTVVTRSDRGFRATGRGEVDAFYEGLECLETDQWEFIVKLDADLAFEADYFAECLSRFRDNPRLGIAGGTIVTVGRRGEYQESHPRFHVRGATKIYRHETWNDIGGLVSAPGWDTLDEIRANMLDWVTLTFSDVFLTQLRPTGSSLGQWQNFLKDGEGCYLVGYHPLYLLARCVVRLVRRPYVIGSAGLLAGYVLALVRRMPRSASPETIRYLRTQQVRRLMGRETVWR